MQSETTMRTALLFFFSGFLLSSPAYADCYYKVQGFGGGTTSKRFDTKADCEVDRKKSRFATESCTCPDGESFSEEAPSPKKGGVFASQVTDFLDTSAGQALASKKTYTTTEAKKDFPDIKNTTQFVILIYETFYPGYLDSQAKEHGEDWVERNIISKKATLEEGESIESSINGVAIKWERAGGSDFWPTIKLTITK